MSQEQQPQNPSELSELMLDYLHGEMTEHDYNKLMEGLKAQPEAAEDLVDLIRTVSLTRELCRLDSAARREFVLQSDPEHSIEDLIAGLAPPDDLEPVDFKTVIQQGLEEYGESDQTDQASAHTPELIDLKRFAIDSFKLIPRRWVLGPVAAGLLIGAAIFAVVSSSSDSPEPTDVAPLATNSQTHVAVLTDIKNARWESSSGEAAPRPGDELEPGQRLVLTAGFASLRTKQGAVAIVEAPTTIELTDNDNAVHLISGKLVGVVESEPAKGFSVRTETAVITDLGTRFGVTHNGTTRTRVIEGEVYVKATEANDNDRPVRLTAGQAAEVHSESAEVVRNPLSQDTFASDWSSIRRQPVLTGEIRFKTHMPRSLAISQAEDERIVMFLERSGVRVDRDVSVTFDTPGRHQDFSKNGLTLPAAMTVDSYFLHLDLPGDAPAGTRRSASITFERPVLAVIARSDHLIMSDDIFGQQAVAYPQGKNSDKLGGVRGMEPASAGKEGITLSDDRLTLTIDMTLVGTSIDQARILVQVEGDPD